MMKVVYYSRPCFLDHVLPQVKALSELVELHLILEISPEAWNSSLFDVPPQKMPRDLVDGKSFLNGCFPPPVEKYWEKCKSFKLIVHRTKKSIHPMTWWTSRKAALYITSLNPDLVHLDDVSLRLSLALFYLRKLPIILTTHDPVAHSGEKDWRNKLARYLTYKHVNKHLLHSSKFQKYFRKSLRGNNESVDFVPLGVLDIFREWILETYQEDDRMILFFGRLSKYKGIDVLFKAIQIVAKEVPDVRLIVAGRPAKGYGLTALPQLPDTARLDIIDEYISNEHLAQLFQEAAVVVCPYLDATQSGVVLTAYAFDKPVIASDTGGLPEYVWPGKTGYLVPPGNHEALADKLIYLLKHPKKRVAMIEGIEKVRQNELNWRKIGSQTVSVYHDLLGDTLS